MRFLCGNLEGECFCVLGRLELELDSIDQFVKDARSSENGVARDIHRIT